MSTTDLVIDNGAYDLVVPSPSGDFLACFTAARWMPDSPLPPISTLAIIAAKSTTVIGTWQLRNRRFWTPDPEATLIDPGIWDEAARSYTHSVWYQGTEEVRTFTF